MQEDSDIDKRTMKYECMVTVGQRMANLLHWFQQEFDGMDETLSECREARELIARWEKEFTS